MTDIKHCIGVVSYCDSNATPDRFLRLKEAISSHRLLKRDDNYMFLWDNGSSSDVKEYLKTCDFYDDIFFSDKNLFINVLAALLNIKAKEYNAKYVTLLAHDYLVFDAAAVQECMKFLEDNQDCGYTRMLKFELSNPAIYDKFGNHPEKDIAHMQRLFNDVVKQPLKWYGPQKFGKYDFYKNNWHWTEFPNVCRASVFDQMYPRNDVGVLQKFEGQMMRNYNSLDLMTGVLDGGAFIHNQRDYQDGSSRVLMYKKEPQKEITVGVKDILQTINNVCGTNYGDV